MILDCYRHAALEVLGEELPADVGREQHLAHAARGRRATCAGERAEELLPGRTSTHSLALHADEVSPFEGVTEMLWRLRDDGCRLGIVTSKLRAVVDLVLDQISYGPAFEVIVTVEDTELHKPDPDPILFALRAAERRPRRGDLRRRLALRHPRRAGRRASPPAPRCGGSTRQGRPARAVADHAFESPLEVVAT